MVNSLGIQKEILAVVYPMKATELQSFITGNQLLKDYLINFCELDIFFQVKHL